ncbi:unnamed protein product [Rotaria magnacalcarata]|uniref:Uncharacterized protein n=1 Tax=Rotaria magnacalcarata TaxID=392030 RepID=A0A815CAT3_9BILA|nr:unnamed protein product [Rotaria magnacalcarata]
MNRNRFDFFLSFTLKLYLDESPLTHMSKNQISSLFINLITKDDPFSMRTSISIIVTEIFKRCANLRCLKLNPSLFDLDTLNNSMAYRTTTCSTLLELHVTLTHMPDCLYILDGHFDQLRIPHVTCDRTCFELLDTEHRLKLLPNLRIFSLCCEAKIFCCNESIVLLSRRMLNLEELDLNFAIKHYEKFIDGDTLKKDTIS